MKCHFIDFHCHLDLYPNFEEMVTECDQAEVFTLTVTTTPKAWPRNREIAEKTKYVKVALGLHPQLVEERASELSLWDQYLPEARYVGEVGLDAGPRFYRSLDIQKQVFESILRSCARAGGKILTVHSVRAVTAVLDLIEAHLPSSVGKVVLHWFGGNRSEIRRALDLGCYFSVNVQMFQSDRGRDLVATLPLDRVLTETDGPFVSRRDRPARPTDVGDAVNALATLHGLTVEAMSDSIFSNLRGLVQTDI